MQSSVLGPSRSIFDLSCIIIETKDLNNTIEKNYYPTALFDESRTKNAGSTFCGPNNFKQGPCIFRQNQALRTLYFQRPCNLKFVLFCPVTKYCQDNLNFQHIYLILIATMIYPALKKLDPNHQER